MSLGDDDKVKVQQATDLVGLIGEHVALRPKGREMVGLCPFHEDSNPSMRVSPAKQIFKCFSCGAGGDAFSFVMRYHQLGFRESLEMLAQRAGIELTRRGRPSGGPRGLDDRKRLSEATAFALEFFRTALQETRGAEARAYLDRRDMAGDIAQQFQLGTAPDSWDALTSAASKGGDPDALDRLGLIRKRRDSSGRYDVLRKRLIFPICDELGRPIAFGGRRLDDEDEPKYLNSPESPLFDKSATLYGLHLAKQSVTKQRTAVVVEGYTDVLACHRHGLTNVVAALGTALTPKHAKVLRRFAERVVLVLDGDEAGQRAAERALDVFLTAEVDIGVAVLPEGQDPDEFLAQPGGTERWVEMVDQAEDAVGFEFARLEGQLNSAQTLSGRAAAAQAFLDRLAQRQGGALDPIRQGLVASRVAGLLHVHEDAVLAALQSARPAPARPFQRPPTRPVEAEEPDFLPHEASDTQAPASPGEGLLAPRAAEPLAEWASSPRLARLGAASEQGLIGALLLDPALLGRVMVDGVPLDEAFADADFVLLEARVVFARLLERWAESAENGLSPVLADLGEMERPDWCAWAAEAAARAETLTEGAPDGGFRLANDAASGMIEARRRFYHAQRRLAETAASGDEAVRRSAERLADLSEAVRTRPDPRRIARPRAGGPGATPTA
ncbi:MAG: DNA primase [Planctomycetota bacterium]